MSTSKNILSHFISTSSKQGGKKKGCVYAVCLITLFHFELFFFPPFLTCHTSDLPDILGWNKEVFRQNPGLVENLSRQVQGLDSLLLCTDQSASLISKIIFLQPSLHIVNTLSIVLLKLLNME